MEENNYIRECKLQRDKEKDKAQTRAFMYEAYRKSIKKERRYGYIV